MPENDSGGILRLEGQIIGPCRIVRLIGSGGMGSVYLGVHTKLESQVAIKVLSRALADDKEYIARFEREAKSLAQLQHPNIVGVMDFGEDGGHRYIVTQFVDGRSVKDEITSVGRLSINQAVAVMRDILKGLAYAHDHGFVHRDIKPSNILLDGQGNARITDFGLVKTVGAEQLTMTGEAMGTPHYMSPEQWDGADPDPRMDIWSAGVTLYHMLAGRVPFEGSGPTQIVKNVAMLDPDPLVDLGIVAPQGLQEILDTMLAKEPGDRYSSAMDVVADLNSVSSGYSTPAAVSVPDGTLKVDRKSRTATPRAGRRGTTGPHKPVAKPSRPVSLPVSRKGIAKALIGILLVAGVGGLALTAYFLISAAKKKDRLAWQSASSSAYGGDYDAGIRALTGYLDEHPNGIGADDARSRISALEQQKLDALKAAEQTRYDKLQADINRLMAAADFDAADSLLDGFLRDTSFFSDSARSLRKQLDSARARHRFEQTSRPAWDLVKNKRYDDAYSVVSKAVEQGSIPKADGDTLLAGLRNRHFADVEAEVSRLRSRNDPAAASTLIAAYLAKYQWKKDKAQQLMAAISMERTLREYSILEQKVRGMISFGDYAAAVETLETYLARPDAVKDGASKLLASVKGLQADSAEWNNVQKAVNAALDNWEYDQAVILAQAFRDKAASDNYRDKADDLIKTVERQKVLDANMSIAEALAVRSDAARARSSARLAVNIKLPALSDLRDSAEDYFKKGEARFQAKEAGKAYRFFSRAESIFSQVRKLDEDCRFMQSSEKDALSERSAAANTDASLYASELWKDAEAVLARASVLKEGSEFRKAGLLFVTARTRYIAANSEAQKVRTGVLSAKNNVESLKKTLSSLGLSGQQLADFNAALIVVEEADKAVLNRDFQQAVKLYGHAATALETTSRAAVSGAKSKFSDLVSRGRFSEAADIFAAIGRHDRSFTDREWMSGLSPLSAAKFILELPDDASTPRSLAVSKALLRDGYCDFTSNLGRLTGGALSPGNVAVACNDRNLVTLWNQTNAAPIRSASPGGTSGSVAISPDSRYIALGDAGGTVYMLVAPNLNTLWYNKAHSAAINNIVFSPDGRYVISGGRDSNLVLFNTTGGVVRTINTGRAVLSVAFSPDSKFVLAGRDHYANLWEVSNGRYVRNYRGSGTVTATAFSPDGTRVVTGSSNGSVCLWEKDSGKKLASAESASEPAVSLSFTPDGRHVIAGMENGDIFVRPTSDISKVVETLHMPRPASREERGLAFAAISPKGGYLLAGNSSVLRLWYLASDPVDGDIPAQRRFLVCRTCGGDGICPACGGDGKARVKCPTCGGTGRIQCPVCKGQKETCTQCKGKGSYNEYAYDELGFRKRVTRKCSACDGTGFKKCPKCGHAGTIDCPDCEDGIAIDDNSRCTTCHGSGKCVMCGGKGLRY
ncbi:MAG: protein kinase [Planctomycetes bacterium]|nr:protein kinase [Planctomycetota bacterium]